MKIVKKKKSTDNCNFYSREKSLYIASACFRNEEDNILTRPFRMESNQTINTMNRIVETLGVYPKIEKNVE